MSRIFDKPVASIHPLYLAKVEKKDRTKDGLDEVIRWLTRFDQPTLQRHLDAEATFRGRSMVKIRRSESTSR